MMRGEFGLSLIINPEREAAKEIFRLLQLPGFLKRETFAKGRVEIVELRVLERSPLENVILNHLPHVLGCKVLVCAVIRDGHALIPSGDTMLRRGDHIYVTAPVTVRLLDALRAHGMDVPIDALTVSDCADAVAAALKK